MRKSGWMGFWTLAGLFVATAARAECTKDLDCSGEQICEEGRCADPPPAVATAPSASGSAPVSAVPSTSGSAPVAVSAGPRPAPAPPRVRPPRVIAIETPAASPQAAPLERRSLALTVAGSLLTAGGVVGLLVGLVSTDQICHRELADDFTQEHCEFSANYWAYGLGAGALLGGVVMIVLGEKRVPAEPVARVSPWLAPQATGLTLRLKL